MKKIIILGIVVLFVGMGFQPAFANDNSISMLDDPIPPVVKINIDPYTIVYEGDIINCTITGNPTVKYWFINNQSEHTIFHYNDPIIFDPEPTPLDTNYVNLTVYAENEYGETSDTVIVMIKRIYFGDIHWHSRLSDGVPTIDQMYQFAIYDNYLDFVACSDHASLISPYYNGKAFPLIRKLINKIFGPYQWQIIKNKAVEYYDPGDFTTLLGFEWSAHDGTPGGFKWSPNGREDVSHINFYYRDIYPNAPKYAPYEKLNYDDIFQAMAIEWDKGHLNIGFPHHPMGKYYPFGTSGFGKYIPFIYTTNWSFLARGMKNSNARDKILRGVEVYSRWGTSIGQYSNIPITWPYLPDDLSNRYCLYNQTDAWVENGMWEWSENSFKNKKFVMQAGSDTHAINRPGSAKLDIKKVSGIIACYSVHNTREEIWDSINNCSIYGSQPIKIRANVRFDDQMNLGGWINCTVPLNITITAMSTFLGNDSSGKSMCPHKYLSSELDYPIDDIWLIKKDREKGRPWCKVINHTSPDSDSVVVNFQDYDVHPNDFYYVAIKQKGQEIKTGENEYMIYIGPIFIDNVD